MFLCGKAELAYTLMQKKSGSHSMVLWSGSGMEVSVVPAEMLVDVIRQGPVVRSADRSPLASSLGAPAELRNGIKGEFPSHS